MFCLFSRNPFRSLIVRLALPRCILDPIFKPGVRSRQPVLSVVLKVRVSLRQVSPYHKCAAPTREHLPTVPEPPPDPKEGLGRTPHAQRISLHAGLPYTTDARLATRYGTLFDLDLLAAHEHTTHDAINPQPGTARPSRLKKLEKLQLGWHAQIARAASRFPISTALESESLALDPPLR